MHKRINSQWPKQVKFFFCPSPLPFGGSTVLRLTRGPAGNRTTTGSLSAPSRTTPYQLSHEDTWPKQIKQLLKIATVHSGSQSPLRRALSTVSSNRLVSFKGSGCQQSMGVQSVSGCRNPRTRPALSVPGSTFSCSEQCRPERRKSRQGQMPAQI